MSYLFDGVDQYLSLSNGLGISNWPITISVWFKAATTTKTGDILSFSQSAADEGIKIKPRADGNDDIKGQVRTGASGSTFLSDTTYSADTWHHVAVVISGNTSRYTYLDGDPGTEDTSPSLTYPSGIDTLLVGTQDSGMTEPPVFWEGYIAEVAVYDVALSGANITTLAGGTAPTSVSSDDLVFYAPLYDDLVDDIGALTFTNNNAATQDNDHPTITGAISWKKIALEDIDVTFNDVTISTPSSIYALSHDSFADFVADEHIAHSGVTITAGTGLTGTHDIATSFTLAVDGLLEDLDTLGPNSSDSEFMVGTGAGALAWESGNTARTSLGLGTGDSPTFTAVTTSSGFTLTGPGTLGDGGSTNYTAVAADGEITLAGTARVKREHRINATDFNPGASGPTAVVHGLYPTYEFTIGDDMYASFEIPPDWDSSTDVTVEIYWAIDEAYATNNGEVQWYADWYATPVGEDVTSPTHTGSIDFGDVAINASANVLTKTTGTIAAASLSAGDLVGLHGSRVALDDGSNPTAEPYIVMIQIEHTANKLGEAT